MSEQKYKKAIFICWIISGLSATILFILIVAVLMASLDGMAPWYDGIGKYLLLGAVYILPAGAFLPLLPILWLRKKMQPQNADDRIKKLEQELEQLKKDKL